jgi:hypothetical protein
MVDLGSAQPFSQLEMQVPGSPDDYARAYQVQVSTNDSSWSTVASCTGTSVNEIVSVPQQTARYVRVVLTASASNWWSIDEFNLYYDGNCGAPQVGTALARGAWTASSNAPSASDDAPHNALDGNLTTRFATNENQAPGLYYLVDLGSAQAFYRLEMQVPGSPYDYARAFKIQVSTNDSSWSTVASCTGTSITETVSFPTQTDRYVRVVLTASATNWWSIDEFNLYTATETTTTTLSSSANPSVTGQQFVYTAKVAPVPPGGTVSFYSDGALVPGCQAIAVNTSSGDATCSARYYFTGNIEAQAYYSGNASYASSSSNIYEEFVHAPAPGYWLATANGQVYGLGAAPSLGGVTTSATTGPVVGIAATPTAEGYWVVTANGTVSAFGDAKFFGDLPDLGKHVSDVVAIAPTFDGQGYYLVGADGGFFTFGDAKFHGSIPGIHRHVRDVVGMVSSPSGEGYLLVGSDGGVFTFGTTRFFGSLPGLGKHVHDIRAILPSSTGLGYILVGSDGGAFNFGTGAKFHGSLPGEGVRVADIVGIALSPDDGGYVMAGSDGKVYAFGDAQIWGDPVSLLSSNLPVAAIAGT